MMDLARGLGLRKQYAWLMWHGNIALSLDMLRRIHQTFGVPVEVLAQVTRKTPEKRRGRKPAQLPPEEPRPDRFGWQDGDVTITEPEEKGR